jgi:hypothetical protein
MKKRTIQPDPVLKLLPTRLKERWMHTRTPWPTPCITNFRLVQYQGFVAERLLRRLHLPPHCEIKGVRGSDYHNGQYNEAEMYPIKALGGEYCGVKKKLNIAEHRILITHKVTNAQFYLEQAAGRVSWISKLREADEKQMKGTEVLFTAHLHSYLHLKREWRPNVPKHIIFCPCWQTQNPFVVTNCSSRVFKYPTIGALYGVLQEDLPPFIEIIQHPNPGEDEAEENISVQDIVRRRTKGAS